MMLEDKLLIWKYNRGRKDVLERIYTRYKDDMMTLAIALLYDKGSAEDVVHDVFVKFIRSCGQMRLNQNLKGYLITCIVNAVRNKNKAGQKQGNILAERFENVNEEASRPDIAVMFNEQAQILAQTLAGLSYDQREVLLLRLYSGMKFRAIAKLTNESLSTIQGRYRYGLNKLRSLLNGEVEK
jgi:RNA polymerase sigma-70 factor (ECF subfamily)